MLDPDEFMAKRQSAIIDPDEFMRQRTAAPEKPYRPQGPTRQQLGIRDEPTPEDILANPLQAAFAIENQRGADEAKAVKDYYADSLNTMAEGAKELVTGEAYVKGGQGPVAPSTARMGGASKVMRGGMKAAMPVALPAMAVGGIAGGLPYLKATGAEIAGGYLLGKGAAGAVGAAGGSQEAQDFAEDLTNFVPAARAFSRTKKLLEGEKLTELNLSKPAEQNLDDLTREAAKLAEDPVVPAPAPPVESPTLVEVAVPAAKAARARKPKTAPATALTDAPVETAPPQMKAARKRKTKVEPPATTKIEGAPPEPQLSPTAEPESDVRVVMVKEPWADGMWRALAVSKKENASPWAGYENVKSEHVRSALEGSGYRPENIVGDLSIGVDELDPASISATSLNVLPNWRRKGIASEMFNAAEKASGMRAKPSELISEDAKAFWAKRNPAASTGPATLPLLDGEIPVSMRELREASPLKGAEFDKAMIEAADRGEVNLTTHDHGGALTPEQRVELGLVRDDKDPNKWYTAATRVDAPPGDMAGRPVSEARQATQTGALTLPKVDLSAKIERGRQFLRKQTKDFVDKYHELDILERVAKDEIPDELSAFKAARSYQGKVAGVTQDKVIDLRNIVRPAEKAGIWDTAVEYGRLQRHKELMDRATREGKTYETPEGYTPQQLDAELANMRNALSADGKLADVEKTMGQYRDWHRGLMRELKNGGVLSQEQLDGILKDNEFYQPLRRLEYIEKELEGTTDMVPAGGNAFSVAGENIIHRAVGSEKEIADPLISSVQALARVTKIVERNNVARRIAVLANKPEFQPFVRIMKQSEKVPAGYEAVSFLQDGVKNRVMVPEGVGRALKNMDVESADMITEMLGAAGDILRKGVTMHPAFMAKNVARDAATAQLMSGRYGMWIGPTSLLRGFTASLGRYGPGQRGDSLYREFLRSGGAFGGGYHKPEFVKSSPEWLKESPGRKVMKTIRNPAELMQEIGETLELTNRLAAFDKQKRMGAGNTRAGWVARNITVDFQKSGEKMRVLNKSIPFLNANVQAKANVLGAFKEAPVATMTRFAVTGVAPLLAIYAYNNLKHPQEYAEVSNREKEKNFVIITGDGRDENGNFTEAVKIPKGDMAGPLNMFENFLDWYRGKNPRGWKALMVQSASDFSPIPFARDGKMDAREPMTTILPTPFKAPLEDITNQNLYTGRDIDQPWMIKENITPSNRYTHRTPQHLVAASKALSKVGIEKSPAMIQNYLQTIAGYSGRTAADPSKFGEQMARTFTGAYAEGTNTQAKEQLDAITRKEGDRNIALYRESQKLYELMKKSGQDAMFDAFDGAVEAVLKQQYPDGKITDDQRAETTNALLDKFLDVSETRELNLTPFDRQIKDASSEERAAYMMQQLDKASDEQAAQLLDEWEQKKLLTPKVMESMTKILARQ